MTITFPISSKRITRVLAIVMICLIVAGVVASLLPEVSVELENELVEKIRGEFIELFSLDEEANVPTWFASFLLLFSASLLAIDANK